MEAAHPTTVWALGRTPPSVSFIVPAAGRRSPAPPIRSAPCDAAATLAAADSAPATIAAAAEAAMAGDTMGGTLASRCTSRGRRCWCTASSASRDAPGHPQSQVRLTSLPGVPMDGFGFGFGFDSFHCRPPLDPRSLQGPGSRHHQSHGGFLQGDLCRRRDHGHQLPTTLPRLASPRLAITSRPAGCSPACCLSHHPPDFHPQAALRW